MPYSFVDSTTFDDPVVGPAGSDPVSASTYWRQAMQSLCNRTRYLKNLLGAASGIATLDASSRVVQLPKNAIYAAGFVANSGANQLITTSSTYSDVTGAVLNSSSIAALLTLAANDLVFVDALVTLFNNTVPQNVSCKAVFSENAGAWTDEPGAAVFGPAVASQSVPHVISFCHKVTTGGAFGVKLQGKAADNTTSSEVHLQTMRLFVVRP